MRRKKGNHIIMNRQLSEQAESFAQGQEPNAVADQELEVITGGSVRKSARDGAVGGAVLGPGIGAAAGVNAVRKYNASQKVLDGISKKVSGKGKIGAVVGGAALGSGIASATGAAYGAIGGAISKG
jgi:hypothetical protein